MPAAYRTRLVKTNNRRLDINHETIVEELIDEVSLGTYSTGEQELQELDGMDGYIRRPKKTCTDQNEPASSALIRDIG
jgi:hypothetical protein